LRGSAEILIFAVVGVGVLHTLVPDHWVPITLIARQRGWSRAQTARAAAGAGLGHTLSTLAIALVVWLAGLAFALRFGRLVDIATSAALIAFGLWIAISSLLEIRTQRNDQAQDHAGHGGDRHDGEHSHGRAGHAHPHHHPGGSTHVHWHWHERDELHAIEGDSGQGAPMHSHEHSTSARAALLLILGSSPMVEGIPAFFAAAKYGAPLIIIMSLAFALSTIATYVLLCVASLSGLQRANLGPLERYGEVLSGAFIVLVGIAFLFMHQP